MKNKAFMRILMLLLALCMTVSVFAACATEDEDGETATEDESSGSATEATSEEITNDVDITLDREVRILYSDYLASLEAVQEEDIGEDVVKNLRRGFWSIQAHIDLHGMRTDDAREAVATFIHKAVMHDLRCVRIVHGKGLNSQGAPILKIRTRRWLRQKEEVLAYVEAPPEDGGSGAVRILLAKRNR